MAVPLAALLPLASKLIDRFIPDKEKAAEAKLELLKEENENVLREIAEKSSIITTEAKSEHWLVAAWRPITMLTFVGLIVMHWLGFTAENLPEDQVMALLEIVKIGLGGYVLGRSAEKGVKAWRNNE